MSESVRFFLESRVPELEDLFKKGLFSRDEIKEIVAKRTKFEHKIKRRGCLLEDFNAYLRYEEDLETVRQERASLLKVKGKHTVSDHSIVKHALSLYRRALTKFRGNLELWDRYIAFAQKAKANKAMTKIFASALQLHPENVQVWIKAARWELDVLQNPASARALLLRALRINKTSLPLWLAYFQMELQVADKLAGAKMELGDANFESSSSTEESTVFSGAIPISVFRYAVRDCPLSAQEAHQFYLAAAEYQERLSAVSAAIDAFVDEAFGAEAFKFHLAKAEAAIAQLDLACDSAMLSVETCMRELNVALKGQMSASVIEGVIAVLARLLQAVSDNGEMRVLVTEKMQRIFSSAFDNSCMTASLYVTWLSVASNETEKKRVLGLALASFPENAELGQLKLSLCQKDASSHHELQATIMSRLSYKSNEFDAVLKEMFTAASDNDDLLSLAQACIKHGRPVEAVCKYALKHSSALESLFALVDLSRCSGVFLRVFMEAILDAKMETKSAALKFLNKLTIFASQTYRADTQLCLLLARAALSASDLELLNRVTSQVVNAEAFNVKFEEMKAALY